MLNSASLVQVPPPSTMTQSVPPSYEESVANDAKSERSSIISRDEKSTNRTNSITNSIVEQTLNKDNASISTRNEEDEVQDRAVVAQNDAPWIMSEPLEFPKGFPETHYAAWASLRIAVFLATGIPFGMRRDRRINCHGHGGKCGKYYQERPCKMKRHNAFRGRQRLTEQN